MQAEVSPILFSVDFFGSGNSFGDFLMRLIALEKYSSRCAYDNVNQYVKHLVRFLYVHRPVCQCSPDICEYNQKSHG